MAKLNAAAVSKKQMNEWEIEDDLRTLQRAIEIKKDPERMKRVKELAKKRLEEMASLAGAADAA